MRLSTSLLLPRDEYPSFEEIEENNQGKFRHYGLSGFSVSDYHEFLVSMPNEKYVCFKIDSIEVTFGQATPLAAMLFEAYHREKYFGEWHSITTLRIVGAGADEAEISFINACAAYDSKFGILPELVSMDEDLLFQYDEDANANFIERTIVVAPPVVTNIDPLRFFYNALSQGDDIAACIYFYRALEYFSFLTNANEMRRLRHDPSISDADFSRRILDLVSRDEKGPIFKLITSLVDDPLPAGATAEALIASPSPNLLCEELYSFRNSIVHGKFSYGYSLQSGSILNKDLQISKWRWLLRNLARKALEQYGAKKL
jgi:hypothetical protein